MVPEVIAAFHQGCLDVLEFKWEHTDDALVISLGTSNAVKKRIRTQHLVLFHLVLWHNTLCSRSKKHLPLIVPGGALSFWKPFGVFMKQFGMLSYPDTGFNGSVQGLMNYNGCIRSLHQELIIQDHSSSLNCHFCRAQLISASDEI